MLLLEKYRKEINRLCNQYSVKRLYAFGSILTKDFNPDSDVDLIVDFNSMPLDDYADNYFDLKFSLQNILKRPIDLLEEKAIRNPYFKQEIQGKRYLIYGK